MEKYQQMRILSKTEFGVAEASWSLDAMGFSAGVSRVVVSNFGGVFNPIRGRSRKAVLLCYWANDSPVLKRLDAGIGLEIGACPGNASRMPV